MTGMYIPTTEEIEGMTSRHAVTVAYCALGFMAAGLIEDPWDFGELMVALGKRLGFAPLKENLDAFCVEREWVDEQEG